ncbi:hypothetical protein SDC9_175441 [bioreactor metagenome]|uniref:Uncharacterized protein n=1 Tax=bioreactor metagenome TaxID=1076179 RepID=A0A645GM97_9ZZZZ
MVLKLLEKNGHVAVQSDIPFTIDSYSKKLHPYLIKLPQKEGGYLLVAEYFPEGKDTPVVSRRYINIAKGNVDFEYYTLNH